MRCCSTSSAALLTAALCICTCTYLKYLIHHYDKTYPLYCSLQKKVIEKTKNRAELAENQVELANNRADDAETQTGVLQAQLLMMGVVSVSLLVGMVFFKRTH